MNLGQQGPNCLETASGSKSPSFQIESCEWNEQLRARDDCSYHKACMSRRKLVGIHGDLDGRDLRLYAIENLGTTVHVNTGTVAVH